MTEERAQFVVRLALSSVVMCALSKSEFYRKFDKICHIFLFYSVPNVKNIG